MRPSLRAELEHRPNDRPDYVTEEAVGGDREIEAVAVALPGRRAHIPPEHFVLRLGRERAEVVLARQVDAAATGEASSSARPPEHSPGLERRRAPPGEHAVAVRA